jgi:hypothetical protein
MKLAELEIKDSDPQSTNFSDPSAATSLARL